MFPLGGGKLYRQLYSDKNLTEAWRKVRVNSDAPGVDGMTVQQFGARLFLNLKALQRDLEKQRYYPQPIKRIYISKSDGTRRPLGILTVRDRIVQRALLQVIEPVFEDRFEECSYGFRKGRSVQMAIDQVARLANQGHRWVADLDIASFFENINTKRLYGFIKAKIRERELRRIISAYLELEIVKVEKGGALRKEESRGVLQGGILSPLFANIYMDRFDKLALKQSLKLVRYADDILILCRSKPEAEKALKTARKILKKLGLELNPKKTQIGHLEKQMRFLGENLFLKKFGQRGKLVAAGHRRPLKARQRIFHPKSVAKQTIP